MDWTVLAPILAAVGALFGAYGTIQGQRAANVNRRFEMLFGFQGKTLDDVKAENVDLRTRLAAAEANILLCEKDKHKQSLEIVDLQHSKEVLTQEVTELQHTVARLKELIPNGTSLD